MFTVFSCSISVALALTLARNSQCVFRSVFRFNLICVFVLCSSINRFGERKLFYYFNNFHFLIAVFDSLFFDAEPCVCVDVAFCLDYFVIIVVVVGVAVGCCYSLHPVSWCWWSTNSRFPCKVRWHYIVRMLNVRCARRLMLLHFDSEKVFYERTTPAKKRVTWKASTTYNNIMSVV